MHWIGLANNVAIAAMAWEGLWAAHVPWGDGGCSAADTFENLQTPHHALSVLNPSMGTVSIGL